MLRYIESSSAQFELKDYRFIQVHVYSREVLLIRSLAPFQIKTRAFVLFITRAVETRTFYRYFLYYDAPVSITKPLKRQTCSRKQNVRKD